MTAIDLKTIAQDLFMKGVRAADPASAVKRALLHQPITTNPKGRLFVIAFGKASSAMMQQALLHVPEGQNFFAIAVPNYENETAIKGCRVIAAGHPLPDENGLTAGRAITELLESATAQDQVLCLISGGGSALVPTPRQGLSLDDKIAVNKILLEGGFDIVQMNRIRQQLSVLKGGGLLEIAHPASVRALIISDVVGDDLEIIASGPTVSPNNDIDIQDLLVTRQLWNALPQSAKEMLEKPRARTKYTAQNTLICTNSQSLQAIANAAQDWSPCVVQTPLIGDVAQASRSIVECIKAQARKERQLIIWGGETTVNITGTGKGGRNQELAVRVAEHAANLQGDWVFLSGGTDGRDGPTEAAGGIVDRHTLTQARAKKIDISKALQNNDSNRILKAGGGLLKTGATGTNVADIQLFLRINR